MKITAVVSIRGSVYTIESDSVGNCAEGIKQVIAILENPEVINDEPIKIAH